MHDLATRLIADGLPMHEFAQSSGNLTAMGSHLFDLIRGRNLTVYPDDQIRQHVGRCVAVQTSRGFRIAKEKSRHKIDAAISLAMACWACAQEQSQPFGVLGAF